MSKKFLILTTFLLVTYGCYASLPPSEHASNARKKAHDKDEDGTITIRSGDGTITIESSDSRKKRRTAAPRYETLQQQSSITADTRRARTAHWAVEQAKYIGQHTLPDEMPPPALPISETSETDEMPPPALPINTPVELQLISMQATGQKTQAGTDIFLFHDTKPESIKRALFYGNILNYGQDSAQGKTFYYGGLYTDKRDVYGYCCPRCKLWICFQPLSDKNLKLSSQHSEKNHKCPNQN